MKNSVQTYDSIVIGAGHAGVEAALALARQGFYVLMLTMDEHSISRMSCNPAIGGLAKGHIVREIDALGGQMGLAADQTGIQYRMLNRSRGPAVWAPRAQADKEEYSRYMEAVIRAEKNIQLYQAQAVELLTQAGKVYGIRTQAEETFLGKTVIVSTGTFLQGLIHVGEAHHPGGRRGEAPAVGLSDSLRKNGIELVRFKTGTCPRIDRSSIGWDLLEEQKGEMPPPAFSFRTREILCEQLPCHLTYTNEETHKLIKKNLHRSPLYSKRIVGIGPRYCPSIEDKIVKFADKTRHQLYLEPEGRHSPLIYVSGLSTSLPADVQEKMVHSIAGLEEAKILLMGYAIEYDCAPPTQLKHSLETKAIENLFFAGQINCTSGYEEAAGQGLMAGLNAVRKLKNEPPFILDRSEAYLGVLIDDLVTRGTNEPYRMFTSRAEFRLLLRQDNADRRLMKYGYEFDLIPEAVYYAMIQKYERIEKEISKLKSTRYAHATLDRFLSRPEETYKSLIQKGLHSSEISVEEAMIVETEIKYEGYISRQLLEVKRFKKMELKRIPESFDYEKVNGLGREAKEKLIKIKPDSIGQASRIPGISSCDLSLIAVYLEKLSQK